MRPHVYIAVIQDQVPDDEREATTHRLRTQLQPGTPEAGQQGFHTQGHSPQPGWSQPGGHLVLPHPAYP